MRAGAVSIQDVIAEDFRLTGGFHITEDRLAIATLRRWSGRTSRVSELVQGRGVFRGPIFSRMFVSDPLLGEPYVSAKDIVNSDVTPAGYLSRRHGSLLENLRLHEGMILITCSGMNLGRAIWARRDLEGLVASHDLIRIEPDEKAIPPGYLYAFLASRYGHALVRKQIYGGNIKHVEPAHIASLAVPRLGKNVETTAHGLTGEAAKLRDQATAAQREAISDVHALLGWTGIASRNITQAASSVLQRRLDAFHHTPRVVRARETLARRAAVTLGDKVESVFEPNRGPRHKVDDPGFGVPFLSSSEVFRLDPVGEYSISKRRTPHLDKLLVSERDLLLPRSGQLGGIIGRAVLPLPTYYGHAASEHLVRVRCNSKEDAFFLWSVFASEPGYLATIGTAFGSSIPSLDCELIADMQVPWFESAKRMELSSLVADSLEANTRAIHAERKAVRIVEDAIEKGATN
jgi:type I restriction enzyme, S subunit